MNITLLGHYDIASLYALERTMALLQEHTFTVFLSRDANDEAQATSPLSDLAKADKQFCDALLAGEIPGRGPLEWPPTAAMAFNQPNSPKGLAQLAESQPDVVVSIRFRKILKDAAIAIPQQGVINLHSGILPDYRGVMATFWAMLAGEPTIGSTLHRIVDSGIDTGPIISIQKRATRPEKSYLTNVLGLYDSGCDAIATAVRALATGGALGECSPEPGGRYYSFPTNQDIVKFQENGHAFVDGSEHHEVQNTD